MKKVKITYCIDGLGHYEVEVDPHLGPQVGDVFVPDPCTENGHLVMRREVHLERVMLFLKK